MFFVSLVSGRTGVPGASLPEWASDEAGLNGGHSMTRTKWTSAGELAASIGGSLACAASKE